MVGLTNEIKNEINKVIIGKEDVVEKVLMAILAQGHVLLVDVPGVGKTTMALAFSKVLGLMNSRVQFTSDTMPSDIIGFSVYNQAQDKFVYQPGAVMTNILLADEINRTSSRTQSALLEVMEEKQVSLDGTTYPLPNPFFVLATQNPQGSAGTQMLPNSQLDRFLICISMGYPEKESMINILRDRHHENPMSNTAQIVTREQLTDLSEQTAQTHISDIVYEYIAELVEASRGSDLIELGVSPRGALALCRMAKACAYVNGRDFVVPEDVRHVFADVCAHRMVLSSKAKLHKKTAAAIAEELLSVVKMPKVQGR